MWQHRSILIVLRLVLICLLLPAIAVRAGAAVTINGRVRIWNPITSSYEPLRQARVRIVLWEFEDWDTGDLEVWTNDDGWYSGMKGNPWFRSGYNYFVKAFAETDRLEVQSTIPQVDGYQVCTTLQWAQENATSGIDVDIGGDRPRNAAEYRVGGISCFGSADTTLRQNGERAFRICHEMTDHVQWLMNNTVIPTRYFEEKECAFPYNDDAVANFSYTWDAVYVPDATFAGSLEYQSTTFRHELGHGLMLDAYGVFDIPSMGQGPSHSFWDPIGSLEQAWKEGSSDFLADWTFYKRYGRMADDVVSVRNSSRDESRRTHPTGRDTIEAEIDGALWLLVDGRGWKERSVQVTGRPEPNMYYDAFEDPRLACFWPIYEGDEPDKFSDPGDESMDTYVNHLLNYFPSSRYDLKVLLYQRDIDVWGGNHGPSVEWNNNETWNGAECTIPVMLEEPDQLDLAHMTVEVYVNGTRVATEALPGGGWEYMSNYGRFRYQKPWQFVYQHVAPRPGHTPSRAQLHPVVRFVVDDGMTYGERSFTLDPPAGTQIADLRCAVWRVGVRNGIGSSLKDLGISVGLDGVKTPVRLGPWSVNGADGQIWDGDTQIFRMTQVPDSFTLRFSASGSTASPGVLDAGGPQKDLGSVTQSFADTDNFGIGDHVAVVPTGNAGSGTEVRVSYTIFVPNPARESMTRISQAVLDRVRGIPAVSIARLADPNAVRRAAYDTPGANLRIIAGKSSRLLDEYARLQASILEIQEEINAKLNPEFVARFQADKSSPTVASPGGKDVRLIRPAVLARKDMLQASTVPFLVDASIGKAQVAEVPKARRKALEDLRASIEEKQKTMADLCAQAPDLRAKLLESADAVTSSSLGKENKDKLLSGVPSLAERLAALCPSADEFGSIMAKEKQVIDLALGQPSKDVKEPPAKQPEEKNPYVVQPEEKNPPKETSGDVKKPPDEKLPGTLQPAYEPKLPDEKLPGTLQPASESKLPDEKKPYQPAVEETIKPATQKASASGETARWRLDVTGVREADDYAEKFYQEKRVIEAKGKSDKLIILNCRLTNKLEKAQTPVLSERLAGGTMLSLGPNGAIPPMDYDATQASNKWQGYDATSVAPGGSVDFVLIFNVARESKPDMLLFTFLNYPDDVGGEGKTVKIPL